MLTHFDPTAGDEKTVSQRVVDSSLEEPTSTSLVPLNFKFKRPANFGKLKKEEQVRWENIQKHFENIARVGTDPAESPAIQILKILDALNELIRSLGDNLKISWPLYLSLVNLDRSLRDMRSNNKKDNGIIVAALEQAHTSCHTTLNDWEAKATLDQRKFRDRFLQFHDNGYVFLGGYLQAAQYVEGRLDLTAKDDLGKMATYIKYLVKRHGKVYGRLEKNLSILPYACIDLIIQYFGILYLVCRASSELNVLIINCIHGKDWRLGCTDYQFQFSAGANGEDRFDITTLIKYRGRGGMAMQDDNNEIGGELSQIIESDPDLAEILQLNVRPPGP